MRRGFARPLRTANPVHGARAGRVCRVTLGLAATALLAWTACAPRSPRATTAASLRPDCEYRDGAIIRGPTDRRRLALMFTGHEFAEGGEVILDELARRQVRASFFVTGHFLGRRDHRPLVRRIVEDGHYLGPHSDAHLLYCSWERPPRLLVTQEQFARDLEANLAKLARAGVRRDQARFFLPPYEHYTARIADWTGDLGLTLVNFTPGTRANADYTPDTAPNFVSSQAILDSIVRREREDPRGLNGFLLLLHLGAGPYRTDKFHARLGELLDHLKARGYEFARVDELLWSRASARGTAGH